LLPQEFKELGSERLVVIFENCKPILGEKIRYYRDKAFTSRLLSAPAVPRMDMDLHLARVQQRWRYADDELAPGESLGIESLAYCSSPPKPPTVDESQKRLVNSQAAVELQVCKYDLQNTRLLAADSGRLAQTTAATLANIAARQQMLATMQGPTGQQAQANSV